MAGLCLIGEKAARVGLSDVSAMALLPCGDVFRLADLAFLDRAGDASWMKIFRMKGVRRYSGGVNKGRGRGGVCKDVKAQVYPTMGTV